MVTLTYGICLANGWPSGITAILPGIRVDHAVQAGGALLMILACIEQYNKTKLKTQALTANGNICPKCHYPTHVVPGAQCPECGTVYSEAVVGRWHKWIKSSR